MEMRWDFMSRGDDIEAGRGMMTRRTYDEEGRGRGWWMKMRTAEEDDEIYCENGGYDDQEGYDEEGVRMRTEEGG